MDSGQNNPDQGNEEVEEGVWHPPDQNALLVEAQPPVLHASTSHHNYAEGAQMVQGYHAQPQFDGSQYQELRPSFSGAYQISTGAQQELFQAAHSTYGRMTPPGQGGYGRQDGGDSEAMPAYSTMSTGNGGQLIAASTVDSSSLQQGYLVLEHDHHHVVRVVSPTDCTVSQSTIGVGSEGADRRANSTLLQMPAMSTGNQYVTMQVTSMPSFSSHGEVSTSSSDREPSVSSLGAAFHHRSLMASVKMEEETTGECDTTQEDLDCHPHLHAPSYLHAVSMASHSVGMESEGLHSTMMSVPRAVTATVASVSMEVALDSNHLSTLQSVALDGAGPSSLGEDDDGDLDHTVDSSAISDIDGSMASDSEAAESSNMDVEVSPFRALMAAAREEDQENQPSTSGTQPTMQPAQPVHQTRKSTRLAILQEEISSSRQRSQYEPRPYNSEELWCEECQSAYDGQCLDHRLAQVPDKVVLSRAWASLPSMLQIYRLSSSAENGGPPETAVFAKRQIAKNSQFGPFVGDMVDSVDQANSKLILMLEKPDKCTGYFDISDENKCNWMMFVRPAASFAEQNLVVYQHGEDIYFTVTKTIEPRQELKVWYAAHYAERLCLKAHEPTDADWALLDEQASRYQCGQCSKKFRTSMALQRHLLEHESEDLPSEPLKMEVAEEEGGSEQEGKRRRGRRRVRVAGKGPLLKANNRQGEDAAGTSGYQWKKKSTSIYLNKTLKKYQKRPGLRQPIKSLYRRKGQGAGGGQEWVCTHCNLTFDNSNVLNLHTLVHAAEDVGMDEIRKLTYDPGQIDVDTLVNDGGEMAVVNGSVSEGSNVVSIQTYLMCPMCRAQFDTKRELIEHAAAHAKAPRLQKTSDRPHKCQICWKAFSVPEKLQKHLLCHGDDASKPLECEICLKRFMNNSALSCHMKTHSEKKYYECPMCHEGFDHVTALKDHVITHADGNGNYTCPYCEKPFEDYNFIRKHMRSFHSEKQYACGHCARIFPRPDKLKLHMLRHTSHREFMCETCGRQFKRKDKLKEHTKRMHSEERETRIHIKPERHSNSKKFVPKVLPTDYHRFIYKCHTCLLGFKRRGMLVNHLAKRHPDVKPESVPELNLPILRTQRDYYCQHCDKVYKSSSKRKAHILKNHPGAQLPPSSRKKPELVGAEVGVIDAPPGVQNVTFSQTVGSITTMPHGCEYCHKQYASKAKLMQHQRKSHQDLIPAVMERRKSQGKDNEFMTDLVVQTEDGTSVAVERYDDVVVTAPTVITEHLQAADLLTQAMSELTQTLQEYRPGTTNITVHAPDPIQLSRLLASAASGGTPTLLQVQPNGTLQPATIELSHLTQALSHAQFTTHPSHLSAGATLIAAAAAATQPQQQHVISAQPINISVVHSNGTTQTIPVSISGNQAYVPRTWASTFQTFQR